MIMMNPLKPSAQFLLAPAGSGKTSLIFDFFQRNERNILVVLPLKCLEREVARKIKKLPIREVFIEAVTVEKAIFFIEKLSFKNRSNLLIVLDEVHLWNFWGNDFRPILWECFYYFAGNEFSLLGLTATLKNEYIEQWAELFRIGNYSFEVLDYGNGKLVNIPSREDSYFGLEKSQLRRRICHEIESNKTCLIFCQYREEVFELEKFLSMQMDKLTILTCVGGESNKFADQMENLGSPQVIISTSTLSHGVNLGIIERVFLTYEVYDWDIYLQMKARGGRGGEEFQVFGNQRGLSSLFSRFKLKLFDRYLSLFYA
jgi:ATP-dependent DNA helicase RecQ